MTTIEFIETKIEHLKKVLNNSKSSNRVSPLDDAMRENIKYQIENYECVLKELKKLGELEDLAEQLGIDLQVIFKALKNGVYATDIDTFVHRSVRGIEENGLCVISDFCPYPECDETFYYTDYKITWWLKEDKSE